jgi:hypothetical protein
MRARKQSHVHYRADFYFHDCSDLGVEVGTVPKLSWWVYKHCFILQLGFAFKSCLVLKTVITR